MLVKKRWFLLTFLLLKYFDGDGYSIFKSNILKKEKKTSSQFGNLLEEVCSSISTHKFTNRNRSSPRLMSNKWNRHWLDPFEARRMRVIVNRISEEQRMYSRITFTARGYFSIVRVVPRLIRSVNTRLHFDELHERPDGQITSEVTSTWQTRRNEDHPIEETCRIVRYIFFIEALRGESVSKSIGMNQMSIEWVEHVENFDWLSRHKASQESTRALRLTLGKSVNPLR